MPNRFYTPGEERAPKVQELFATIAARYDLINDLQSFGLHRWWKRRLLRLAQPHPGQRALDVCCGTGDIALALARQNVQTTGLDFSDPMLRIARERARVAQQSIEWIQGDALALPFADATFDLVTVGYGLRNLADFEGGLRELVRVAKPGARVLVLDFGKPPHVLLRKFYFAYLRHVVPLFGRWFCGSAAAYDYILDSLQAYPAQEGVARLMRNAGCTDVCICNMLGGIMSINSCRTPTAKIAVVSGL